MPDIDTSEARRQSDVIALRLFANVTEGTGQPLLRRCADALDALAAENQELREHIARGKIEKFDRAALTAQEAIRNELWEQAVALAERQADELDAARAETDRLRLALQEGIEWVETFDCDCFAGNEFQDSEMCDRCLMLQRGRAALGSAPIHHRHEFGDSCNQRCKPIAQSTSASLDSNEGTHPLESLPLVEGASRCAPATA
jgi:hypothetical protein